MSAFLTGEVLAFEERSSSGDASLELSATIWTGETPIRNLLMTAGTAADIIGGGINRIVSRREREGDR